ncbi:MAG: lipopolysaccharide transport system permease protein [Frankiales bacterium]|nr:lipopolysaccharide transport system permease protein [Frankiales bacterium]
MRATSQRSDAVADLRRWGGLVGILAVKNFRQRYLRSRLGVLWALVQPTAQAIVLSFVFVKIFRIHGVPHYPLYVLTGMMTWQLFATSTLTATSSAVDNGGLVRKVPLPKVVFPLASVGGSLIVYGVQTSILIAGALLAGTLGPEVLLLPLGALLAAALACGLGLIGCAFHVAFRDIRFLLESGLLLMFYATPVLYDPSRLPEGLRQYLRFNPMYGVLSVQRGALLGRAIDPWAVLISAGTAAVLIALGAVAFRRRSPDFADLL